MTSVSYEVKNNEAGVISLVRVIKADDNTTVLAEAETTMAEVRQVAPAVVDSYLEALATQMQDLATHLSAADSTPNDQTYEKAGKAKSALENFISNFDPSLLPPPNL